ncbi:MAG TPA: DUF86 domain-containing protein [Candidatus Nanopelagicaceae bacterium]|nr:DUF86 domain-containing protein [Candidatus Nanopelagicaceae bacterium]
MFKNFTIYLNEIREAINSIERFVEGMTFEDFKSDDKTSSAVIRKLEIIGEATKKIPENIRKKHSQIPWKEISGMRDKLIHAYSKVDLKLVWMTIKQRIPELKSFIQKIMTEN